MITMTRRLNDATPAEWDQLRKKRPFFEMANDKADAVFNKWFDPAIAEAEAEENKQAEKALERLLLLDASDDEDSVNHPTHYNSGGIECIQAIEASMELDAFQGYLKGNILKYIWRMSYKGKALEDCEKAQWYLNKLISTLEDNT
jgi:hypothetical protein